MRILVLNHEYPPVGGGGGQACQDIASELANRGHELIVLTSHVSGLSRIEERPNLKIIRLPVFRQKAYKANFFGMLLYVLEAVRIGLGIIRNWKPSLIHVHFAVPAGEAAYLLHIFTGIPYLLTVHLGDVPGGSPEKTSRWFKWIFPFTKPIWRNAARIVAVSEFTSKLAQNSYGVEPIIIPNGIQLIEHKEIEIHSPPVIFFAGRFVPQKNLDVFIEVLNSIKDQQWKCIMLGDGPTRNRILARIQVLDLSNRFSLPGWVDPTEVRHAMEQSDILFMPSLSEGLSVVGVQALEAGLAIVANNVGGFSDLVEDGKNGVLATPGDVDTLMNALTQFLSDSDVLLQARKESQIFSTRFDLELVVDKYERLMEDILKDYSC
jgi:L-malate glycosyltransferase